MFDKLSMDWLSFTFTAITVNDYSPIFERICKLLRQERLEIQEKSGLRGYDCGATVLDGLGFVGWHSLLPGQGVHVALSSSALSVLHNRISPIGESGELMEFDIIGFLRELFSVSPTVALDNNVDDRGNILPFVKITRIDFALDDTSGSLDIENIVTWCEQKNLDNGEYVSSRFRTCKIFNDVWNDPAIGIGFGRRKDAEVYARIYDKAAEKVLEGIHWVRVEFQYMKDKARLLVEALLTEDDYSIIPKSFLNYLSFRKQNGDDENKSRWPTVDWWAEFLNVTDRLVLGCGVPSTTVEKIMTWLDKQVAPALAVVSIALDREVVKRLTHSGAWRLSKRHKAIINEYNERVRWSALVDFALNELGGVLSSSVEDTFPDLFDKYQEQQDFKDRAIRRQFAQVNEALSFINS